jgi:UDP-N-acetylmuramoylalanine--D-glutamate ligase
LERKTGGGDVLGSGVVGTFGGVVVVMNVLVLGAARSGLAVARLLSHDGHRVTLNDGGSVNVDEDLRSRITVITGHHPESLWDAGFDLVIKNPGIKHTFPFVIGFVDRGIPVINEMEYASWGVSYRYGAITGTNGKTTTTALLGELLKTLHPHNGAYGNIGNPLSEAVLAYPDEPLTVALEMAAFQLLGTPTLHPSVSVILNLTPDHLDVFESLDDYYRAKTRVYRNQSGEDWFLLNLDDAEIVRLASEVPCRVVTFSLVKKADVWIDHGTVRCFDEALFEVSDLQIVGQHNVQNAVVAAAMAVKLGVSPAMIRAGIRAFKGVEHRIEFVRELDGVRYYNDSKGTNAEATIVALKAFDQPIILLAGGYDKKTGFEALKPFVSRITTLIAYGETKLQLASLVEQPIIVETMEEALKIAQSLAKAGDVVLLSPACASYDQFSNYEERGRLFKQMVLRLPG